MLVLATRIQLSPAKAIVVNASHTTTQSRTVRRVIGTSYNLEFRDIEGGLGELWVHSFEGLDDDLGDREVAKPFLVRRDYEPGNCRRATPTQYRLIGLHVIVPMFALLEIRGTDLPVPGRILETLLDWKSGVWGQGGNS